MPFLERQRAENRDALDAGPDAVIRRVTGQDSPSGERGSVGHTRNLNVDLSKAVDIDARTVEVAFSSEEPYLRWFGYEILGHNDGEIDLGRMNDGAALLVDHDWRDVVGVVESVRIEGGVGRATVRFGNSARAEEIFRDVADGIRRHLSVGYFVHEMKLIEGGDESQPDTYRVMSWEPYENSIVAVPADTTVGVGKSARAEAADKPPKPPTQIEVKTMPDEVKTPDPAEEAARQAQIDEIREKARKDAESERTRVSEILGAGEKVGMGSMATEYIKDGKSVEDFYRAIVEKQTGGNATPVTESGELGLTGREADKFSFLKLATAIATNGARDREAAAFELDVVRSAQDQLSGMKIEQKGVLIPPDVTRRRGGIYGMQRAPGDTSQNVGVNADGGFTVATELMPYIENLENSMALPGLGIRMLTGLQGDIAIPRHNGGVTAYWLEENGAAPKSGAAFDQLSMRPKQIASTLDLSLKFMRQTDLSAEAFARSELALAAGLEMDLAGIAGSGAANQPLGILNTTGIGGVTDGTGITEANTIDLETLVADQNAAIGNLSYLTNARVRGLAKKTPIEVGQTDRVWARNSGGTPVNGYPCAVSNQVPKNLGAGTDSAIIFGNWSDLIMGMWGVIDFIVNPYSLDTTGAVRITIHHFCDFLVRHPESFAAKTNIAA